MNLEKFYLKLPDFIKYNPKILNLSFKISKAINSGETELDSQHYLLNFLFTSCDIKIKGPLKNIQLLYIELMRFVDNVCKKHNINYWLGFGTLLGAVRHGGFIPWDDDVDLAILREDYNKLIKVLPEEINRFDYLKENCGLSLLLENNINYFDDFTSVYDHADKGLIEQYRLNFLQFAWMKPYIKLDFFPMDFIEDGKEEFVSKTFLSKKYKFHFDLIENKIKFLEVFDSRRKEAGFTDSKSKFFSDSFESVHFWRVRIFEYEKTFPLKTIKFEGHEFKCPVDVDHHLKVTFGDDYMSIPRNVSYHDYLPFMRLQFDNDEEAMDKAFKDAINYLKKINDEFE